MGIPLGIKVTFRDPEDSTKLIHAQFATVRSHPELRDHLTLCARLDVKESAAVRRMQLADQALWSAEAAEVDAAEKALQIAADARNAVLGEMMQAAREFIEAGFVAAGATAEHASWLADRVAMEDLPELKAKCLYGAGAVDFTRASSDPTR